MTKTWTVTVDDEGNLPLPQDFLDTVGWKDGDNIIWIDNFDGTWSIVKEDSTTIVKSSIIKSE